MQARNQNLSRTCALINKSLKPRIYSFSECKNVQRSTSQIMAQHFSCLSILISCCLTFLVALPHLASTASLIQPTKTETPNAVCVRDSRWLGIRYGPLDCQGAVDDLISSEVQVHRDQEFEFLAPQAGPIHDLPIMQTPRRYTFGSKAPPALVLPLPL